jgi:hypothetical protein
MEVGISNYNFRKVAQAYSLILIDGRLLHVKNIER